MLISVELTDRLVVELLESMPQSEWPSFLERSVLLGETVRRYAQVTASEDNIQRFLEPSLNNLNGAVKSLAELQGTYQSVFAEQHQTLQRVIPAMTASQARGAVTNQSVFESLCMNFREDEPADVSRIPHAADLWFTPPGADTPILIELKDHTKPVPTEEVRKFWRDMEAQNARVGVFISMQTRITSVTHDFALISSQKRIGVFLVNSEFSYRGHLLAYTMARRLQFALQERNLVFDSDKLDLMTRILNRRLRLLRDEIKRLSDITTELDRARVDFDRHLSAIAGDLDGLRLRVQNLVDDTLDELVGELPDADT